MTYAKIVVAAAVYAIDKPYDYLVPEALEESCKPGVRVVVPFGNGNRRSEGFVLSVSDKTEAEKLKAVESVLDREPVMDESMIRMAAFIRQRYFCTFFDAVQAMLPAGLWFHAKDKLSLTALGQSADLEQLRKKHPEGAAVAECLRNLGGRAEDSDLRKFLDKETLEKGLKQLEKKKMLLSEGSLIRNITDKTEKIASLAVSSEEALEYAATRKRAPLQRAVLELLAALGSASVKEICYFTGASNAVLNTLEKAGYVTLEHREVFRRPEYAPANTNGSVVLNEEQQIAYEALCDNRHGTKVSLLYGVTGSGKTIVYIRLIQDALKSGKSALVLVPEIALTPQLMQTFMGYFGDQVAVLHSALPAGQRYDEWKRIRSGMAKVVVGTRSAVFAPLNDLGLVVVDEEHETSYKSETKPRYHARELAIWRGSREGCSVVLGSATPSLETMFLAKSGVYELVRLKGRYNGAVMPQVILSDMKEELREGNFSSIGSRLREEMTINLKNGQQTILYLNRRGASKTVLCPNCGYVPGCHRCSVSLTYHSANDRLMCHYCGYSQPVHSECPGCGTTFRQVGTGTQKVEEEVHKLFPGVVTLRMDADTVSAANPHDKILEKFQKEKIPVLIGTQMVTKGLNFPNVTLVGVLDGDSSLYQDDFRAAEMTFSKITQVVGRAGRGDTPGRAVIQTMTPENEVLLQAARQDYDAFFESELPLRKLRNSPPYTDVLVVKFTGIFESEVGQGALRFREALSCALRSPDYEDIRATVMGPSPARVVRVMNRYHYQLTILAKNSQKLRALLSALLRQFQKDKANKNITATADINPLG